MSPTSETRSRLTITEQGDAIALAGAIDETATLHELLDRAQGGRLVLDLGAVTFINSLGVRDWIRMQAAAQKADLEVELRRVSEPLVHPLKRSIEKRGSRPSSRPTPATAAAARSRCSSTPSPTASACSASSRRR